jgi:hypothetical protein
MIVSCLAYSSTLKFKAIRSFETSVYFHWTTRYFSQKTEISPITNFKRNSSVVSSSYIRLDRETGFCIERQSGDSKALTYEIFSFLHLSFRVPSANQTKRLDVLRNNDEFITIHMSSRAVKTMYNERGKIVGNFRLPETHLTLNGRNIPFFMYVILLPRKVTMWIQSSLNTCILLTHFTASEPKIIMCS